MVKHKNSTNRNRDVLSFLSNAVGNENLYNKTYDIFGPEILTYKQMLMQLQK